MSGAAPLELSDNLITIWCWLRSQIRDVLPSSIANLLTNLVCRF